MRAFVTGGTGFLGGKLAEILRAEGHEVVALVRTPSKAGKLKEIGCELASGDITERSSLADPMKGVDVVYHVAAWYEIGVSDLPKMRAINVDGTRNALECAAEAGVPTIVHCSSVVALGATGKKAGDETKKHTGNYGSPYEQTKAEAHVLARQIAASGAPVRIGLPGTIFGPGDTSLVSLVINAHLRGALAVRAMSDLYMSLVYVDDCARGLKLIGEKGKERGEYNLVGETIPTGEWLDRMADITGRSRARFHVPTPLVKLGVKVFPLVAGAAGLERSMADELWAMAGEGWRFSGEKARRELGWTTTDFDEAWARTLVAFDRNGGRGFRPRTPKARTALEKALAQAKAA